MTQRTRRVLMPTNLEIALGLASADPSTWPDAPPEESRYQRIAREQAERRLAREHRRKASAGTVRAMRRDDARRRAAERRHAEAQDLEADTAPDSFDQPERDTP